MVESQQVFISYKREDAALANAVRLALRTQGLDVWWDESLQTGERWEERIDQALLNALAVVVIWSPRSSTSEWVRHEASIAKIRGVLTHIVVGEVEIPKPFRAIQAVDLSTWNQREDDSKFQSLARSIKQIARRRTSMRVRRALVRAATVLVMLAIGAGLGWRWGRSSAPPPAPMPVGIEISVPSPADVRTILARADPQSVARLRDVIGEYKFVTAMQRWRGNRSDPQGVLKEIETRLSTPVLISKDTAAQMIKEARAEYATWKRTPVRDALLNGYEGVSAVLAPVLSRVSVTTYEQSIFSYPADLYGPMILGEVYSATPEEQYYLVLDLLTKSQQRRWALPFLETHIRATGAKPGSRDFRDTTTAGRQILTQAEFNVWYQQVLAATSK
jgi:hypothetical protein